MDFKRIDTTRTIRYGRSMKRTGQDESSPRRLRALVGENVQRLRKERGMTQDDLARKMRPAGWARATVAAVETGKRALSDEELLYALPLALEITLPHLLREIVQTNERERILVAGRHPTGKALAQIVEGYLPLRPTPRAYTAEEAEKLNRVLEARGEAEQKAARALSERLGETVEPIEIVDASHVLWERTLTDERDARLKAVTGDSDHQRAVRLGHITRELLEELDARLRAHHVRRNA